MNMPLNYDDEQLAGYIVEAESLINSGDYSKAISACDEAVKIKPDSAGIYYERGIAYLKNKDFRRAIDDFNRAIELKPDFEDAFAFRGEASGELMRIKPSNAYSYYERGLLYLDWGNYFAAIDDFTKAIELKPDFGDAYHDRGNAYLDKRDYNRALDDFTKAIEFREGSSKAYSYSNRGGIYLELKDYKKAIDDFTKSLEINKDDAFIPYYNRGMAYMGAEDYNKAAADFAAAVKSAPDDDLASQAEECRAEASSFDSPLGFSPGLSRKLQGSDKGDM